jgi:hypothetical protein
MVFSCGWDDIFVLSTCKDARLRLEPRKWPFFHPKVVSIAVKMCIFPRQISYKLPTSSRMSAHDPQEHIIRWMSAVRWRNPPLIGGTRTSQRLRWWRFWQCALCVLDDATRWHSPRWLLQLSSYRLRNNDSMQQKQIVLIKSSNWQL